MRGSGRQDKTGIILVIVIMVIVVTASVPLILTPTGEIGGGFMMDGERLPFNPLFSFVDPSGNPVDGIWVEMSWTVTGTDVNWATFDIVGFYEIRLWYTPSVPIVLEKYSFHKMGEAVATGTINKVYMDYRLEALLDGQPYTDPSDPTYWLLYLYGEFTMTVEDIDGNLMYDGWDGETAYLRVNWKTGTFSGSGAVSTGW